MLQLRTPQDAPADVLEQTYQIDKQVYSPELCGVFANMADRFHRCEDTFLLVCDGDRVVGSLCFLPVGDSLYAQFSDPEDHTMRDDDITPAEMEPWSTERMNHLFILSVAILPPYRKGEAIRLLSNGFLRYLQEKEADGYRIGSISGAAVSDGGANFIKRLRGRFYKELQHGYRYFRADRKDVEELLEDGLLL